MVITHNVSGAGVILTFDDGPNPEHTPELLDVLDEVGVSAYFFVVGQAVVKAPHLAQEIHGRGHVLCNHTYSHPHLTELTPDERREEIVSCTKAISDITGEPPLWFRPPYFDYNDDIIDMVTGMGMHWVNCSIWTKDTAPDVTSDDIMATLREAWCNDGIILGHEWSKPTRDALRVVIPEFKSSHAFSAIVLPERGDE